MDKVESTKLTALISKLTAAANKGVKKTDKQQDTRKHYTKADYHAPIHFRVNEQNLHTAKLVQ